MCKQALRAAICSGNGGERLRALLISVTLKIAGTKKAATCLLTKNRRPATQSSHRSFAFNILLMKAIENINNK
jgi:hypothetical protein